MRDPRRGLAAVRLALSCPGYQEGPLADAMGLPHLAALSRARAPLAAARLERSDLAPDVRAAASLLLLGREVGAGVLPAPLADALLGLGFASTRPGGRLAPRCAIYPARGALVITDRLPGASRADGEPVMHLGGDSYAIAYLLPERIEGRALDLCTGSGVQGLVLAAAGARVVAVDVSLRALAYARMNAWLNDRPLDLVRGDLGEALSGRARFAWIAANPPFVPAPPAIGPMPLYSGGGPLGDAVVSRIARAAPGLLEPGGIAAIFCVVAERRGEPWRDVVARWLGGAPPCDAALLVLGEEDPPGYAFEQAHASGQPGAPEAFERWLRHFDALFVTRLLGGVLALRRRADGGPGTLRKVDVPPLVRPDPGLLGRVLPPAG